MQGMESGKRPKRRGQWQAVLLLKRTLAGLAVQKSCAGMAVEICGPCAVQGVGLTSLVTGAESSSSLQNISHSSVDHSDRTNHETQCFVAEIPVTITFNWQKR